MKLFKKAVFSFTLLVAISMVSCSENKTTNTKEETEIRQMDSTSRVVKETTEKLEDQTKKVEESLEKLDKEFENKP